jgi:tRNA (pseudouridine54-N1)-methyltransferase
VAANERSLSPVRRFVLIGQTASASGDFSLEDLPSTSGRLDVLLRSIRAALLVSHGLRRGVQVYLVLRGGVTASRILRIDGRTAKFLRPDERSLATLLKKTLLALPTPGATFTEVRPGLELCAGDVGEILSEVGSTPCFVLDEAAGDIREQAIASDDAWFFIGDHLGFDVVTLALLERHGCTRVSVGPVSLHSDDVVALVSNELDRRFTQHDAERS